jgi:hypothetical protein
MNIRINSLNSKIYTRSNFIDCNIVDVKALLERAINIDFDLALDTFESKIQWIPSQTSMTIINPVFLRIKVTPKRVILQQGTDIFSPGRTTTIKVL